MLKSFINKTFIDNVCNFADNNDLSKKVQFNCVNITTENTRVLSIQDKDYTIGDVDLSSEQTLTNKTLTLPLISAIKTSTSQINIPDVDIDTFILQAYNQLLYYKSLRDDTCYFINATDITKKLKFDVSPITTETTRTITPIDEDLTLVGTTNSQILTNKQLTTPIFNRNVITQNTATTLLNTQSGSLIISNDHNGITINLPSISGNSGMEFYFFNNDSDSTLTIERSSTDTFDDGSTTSINIISQGRVHLISDGTSIWIRYYLYNPT